MKEYKIKKTYFNIITEELEATEAYYNYNLGERIYQRNTIGELYGELMLVHIELYECDLDSGKETLISANSCIA